MLRPSRLLRIADVAIPWGVGIFLVLVAIDEIGRSSSVVVGAAVVLAVVQGVALHVSSVLRKLGLRDRVQAVVLAYEVGLVRPGSS